MSDLLARLRSTKPNNREVLDRMAELKEQIKKAVEEGKELAELTGVNFDLSDLDIESSYYQRNRGWYSSSSDC